MKKFGDGTTQWVDLGADGQFRLNQGELYILADDETPTGIESKVDFETARNNLEKNYLESIGDMLEARHRLTSEQKRTKLLADFDNLTAVYPDHHAVTVGKIRYLISVAKLEDL